MWLAHGVGMGFINMRIKTASLPEDWRMISFTEKKVVIASSECKKYKELFP